MPNYPVPTIPRMGWSIDGTLLFLVSGTSVTEYSQATRIAMDDESSLGGLGRGDVITGPGAAHTLGVIFPQLRDLSGFFLQATVGVGPVETTTNSTNGLDGTWSTVTNSIPSTPLFPYYRTSVTVTGLPGVKGIRFQAPASTGWENLHLYGVLHSGVAPTSRLGIWHPSIDQTLPGGWLDWGDAPRASSATKQFRLRNLSSSQTANNVVVSTSAPTDQTPSITGSHSYSTDGVNFSSTISITSIAPNSYSPVITVKRTLSSSSKLGLFVWRVQTMTGSWT